MIPLVDVRAQYAPILGELKDRLAEVVDSGRFILGPNVQAFEQEAAVELGLTHAVGVANGTDALVLVLDALGVGPGDEVICPSFTFYATAEAVARRGATPVFCDIVAETFNLDADDVARKVTSRTKAIIAVHLFGRPAPLGDLPDGIPVVEDAAQAFAAPGLGAGVASTYSFFPTKNLFGLGDGGLIATGDERLADRIRLLRFHGSRDKQTFEAVGYNSRLDELQAAALRLFLPHVGAWNRARREAAARYEALGLSEACELPRDDEGHVYHMYVVRSPERDRIEAALKAAGIGCQAYYRTPLHLQPVFAPLGYREGSLPVTECAARENLALPLWAGIAEPQQRQVVERVLSAATVGAAA